MSIEEQILKAELEKGVFDNAEIDIAEGIAKLAVDKGYDSLSDKQKGVLSSFLSVCCSGLTDPGGHFNECKVVLDGRELLDAYEQNFDSDCLMCEDCRNEQSDHQRQWEKMSDE
jgi:hypothetical protein